MASRVMSTTAEAFSTLPGLPTSMVCGGAIRSTPMTTGAGRGLPDDAMVTTGDTISVVVRLSLPPVPPGRNSVAEPSTVTASPTVTVGAVRVKTRMPSLVARSPSPTGSCIQKPELLRAVTTPTTPFTGGPAKVERCAIP